MLNNTVKSLTTYHLQLIINSLFFGKSNFFDIEKAEFDRS